MDQQHTVIELFAGAGGLALGLEAAGLKCIALNELNPAAAKTLRMNRPNMNFLEQVKNDKFAEAATADIAYPAMIHERFADKQSYIFAAV